MPIFLPTTARPADRQHWCLLCHGAPPVTLDSYIPYHLCVGTWICYAPGPAIPHSSGVSTPSASPPFLPHILAHGWATVTMIYLPPFSTLGNSLVRFIHPSDIIVTMDLSSTLTCCLLHMLVVKLPTLLHCDQSFGWFMLQAHWWCYPHRCLHHHHPAMPCNIVGLFFLK